MLRGIEQKIESLFEGVFGRAFRTHVQPVELARKLAKEMDDGKAVSVSRVYVPNEYSVYLAPEDREQFSSYEESLADELQQYLAEHARREQYALLSQPRVLFETDDDLSVGEFGIATRMAQPAGRRLPEPEAAEAGATMIYRPRGPQPTEAASPAELGVEREVVTLTVDGRRHEVAKRRTLIGRSKECDVQIDDPSASRKHAELRQEGTAYWVVDLDSTNGLEVNGMRTQRAKLDHGDKITIGFVVLLYLFIWRIVRAAAKDVRLPQESMILSPGHAAAAGLVQPAPTVGALVVLKSPALEEGERYELDSAALTMGRGSPNDIELHDDEFASARHARVEPRRDGVWLEDIGSTNGTFVNGTQIDRPRRLTPGDVIRVGETNLRFDP